MSVFVFGRESFVKYNVMKKGENDGLWMMIVEIYDGCLVVMDGFWMKVVDVEYYMCD